MEELLPLTSSLFLQDLKQTGVPDLDLVDSSKLNIRLKHCGTVRKELRSREYSFHRFPCKIAHGDKRKQLKDEDLRKIIHCFENDDKDVNHANWLERGYLTNQGVLYRNSHDSESEEARLVVPCQDRDKILKEHHDSPNAAHYGSDGTYQTAAKRHFWIGMRKFTTNYVKTVLIVADKSLKPKTCWVATNSSVSTKIRNHSALSQKAKIRKSGSSLLKTLPLAGQNFLPCQMQLRESVQLAYGKSFPQIWVT
ncbi:hypothetical protein AVEN_254538-1 [Araneus ventricosus]|uniref:Integrase zinc-binding domain-containing protein n=1 Tax=Araneus ventricosus TaxID=182803 RepID=A0A4Y2MB10_ARAVE|nr:hypothetical protein AVEN_254538-1 [Araneus ventricosus]